MLAHYKQVFVCHANIVHFVYTLDFVTLSEYLFGVVQWYQFEVTLSINNHNSIGWNIRGFLEQYRHYIMVASVYSLYGPTSKHTLTQIHPPITSTASFTINTPLQLTLHPTVPTIPDIYYISPLACNINPTIPPNIIQTFLVQFLGLILPQPSTSVVSSICTSCLFNPTLPVHSLLINITVLVNGPTHWPCPLCTISPTNFPNWT